MPFSAMNIRTTRGFGPTESYNFMVFSPWFLVEAWLLGAVEQATAGFVKWADHIFALPNVIQESH
jgi:hypothetical protein